MVAWIKETFLLRLKSVRCTKEYENEKQERRIT